MLKKSIEIVGQTIAVRILRTLWDFSGYDISCETLGKTWTIKHVTPSYNVF